LTEKNPLFDCRTELKVREPLRTSSGQLALIRLTLVSLDQASIEPGYFAMQTCLEAGGRMQCRVTNIEERLGRGDCLWSSLDLDDLGPHDFPLVLSGKLIFRGRIRGAHVYLCMHIM
jgi:hypothetical protein